MKVNKDNIIEGSAAITIWIIPWVIVGITFALYRDQLSIEQFSENGRV